MSATPGDELVESIIYAVGCKKIYARGCQFLEESLEGFDQFGKYHPAQMTKMTIVHGLINGIGSDVVIDVVDEQGADVY